MKTIRILNGNMLKMIAMITMVIDHVGLLLLDDLLPFRIIGRISFPIYAYLIVEGCVYTRRKLRRFLEVFLLGAICQLAYFVAEGDFYFNVLLTFSVSIPLVYLVEACKKEAKRELLLLPTALATAAAVLLCLLLERADVFFDYGCAGILLPPLIALGRGVNQKAVLFALGIVALSLASGLWYQWFSLLAVIPVLMYNQQRGRRNIKHFFCAFYPLHMLVIWFISLFL